jgi:hypothetical protein
MFTQNKDRESMVHEPLDFEAAALERSARQSQNQSFKGDFAGNNPLVTPILK